MIPAEPELISCNEAAARLGLTEGALANYRSQRRGPKYLKVGRAVFYRMEDLKAWIERCVVDPAAKKAAS